MENKKVFTIYKVKQYKKEWDNETKSLVEYPTYTGTIKNVLKKIESNKGYHLMINPDEPCIVYGDLDHIPYESIFDNFLILLSQEFEVDKDYISYTLSKKDNELSYHWSIPFISATPTIIKSKLEDEIFDEFRTHIDLSIYTKKLFRLPNQTNKDKPIQHNVIEGELIDFIFEYIDNTDEKLIENEKPRVVYKKSEVPNDDITTEIKHCLECIKDNDDYNDWSNVALIINNELGYNGFNILDEWSRGGKNYNYEKNKAFYNNIKPKEDGLRIGTLKMMAKKANPKLYKTYFHQPKVNKNNFDFYDLTTDSVGKYFKQLYEHKFINQNEKLYCFNGIYWKLDLNHHILNNFVSNEFYNNLFTSFKSFEDVELNKNKLSDSEHTQLIERLNKIRTSLTQLKNYDKRQKFLKDILSYLVNDDIKFDDNAYLFAFDNKIYDLKLNQFVEPEPTQYISLTTGYKYIEQDESKKIKELNKLLDSIFPQPEIKKLYLTILSTGLDGVPLEKFVLANGGGGNGKGLLNEFTQYVLGNYAYVLPVNILLGPLKIGSNPEVANMHNKRLIIAREPDRDLKFNCATIKEMTGGTELNARLCHSNDTKTKLKLTFLLECNDKPKLNETSKALGRRILDIPFKNRFVDKDVYDDLDDEDKKTTFLINSYYKTTEFKEEYKQALFLILVEHYKEFYKNNRVLPVPDEIKRRNEEYIKTSDEFLNWFDDNYEKTNDKKDVIKIKVVYEKFKSSEYFNNLTKIKKRENNYKSFVTSIEGNMFLKKYVTTNKDKIYIITNYKIKEDDDDDEIDSLDK